MGGVCTTADESCLYHPGKLEVISSKKSVFTCCQVTVVDERFAKTIRGCTKGRHHSKHHRYYSYSNYFSYMNSLVRIFLHAISHQEPPCTVLYN